MKKTTAFDDGSSVSVEAIKDPTHDFGDRSDPLLDRHSDWQGVKIAALVQQSDGGTTKIKMLPSAAMELKRMLGSLGL